MQFGGSGQGGEMQEVCSTHGKPINAYKILVEKSQGKRTAVVPMCRLENNIKTNPREIGCVSVNGIDV
jgi:hypothetical protein